MSRRYRHCTCAGTAPGWPQHEDWCGQSEDDDQEDSTVIQEQLFYDIVCDIRDCQHALADDGDLPGCPTTQAQAIAEAREQGWRFPGGMSVCPCHDLNGKLKVDDVLWPSWNR